MSMRPFDVVTSRTAGVSRVEPEVLVGEDPPMTNASVRVEVSGTTATQSINALSLNA